LNATTRAPGITLAQSLMACARCVRDVMAGRSLTESLAQTPGGLRPSAQALSFYVLRHLGLAQTLQEILVKKPPHPALANSLLLSALALLEGSLGEAADQVPAYQPYTIVNQTVTAVGKRYPHLKGLVNASLRRYIRERESLRQQALEKPLAQWNYPLWWITKIQQAYPSQWQAILQAGNAPAPLILRVNRRRTSVQQVQERLAAMDVPSVHLDREALWLPRARPVQQLPGFHEGLWSVQDLNAQRAVHQLRLRAGMWVLDACAAPGGKTAQLLEQADMEVLALDASAHRLKRVEDNLKRLGLWTPRVTLQCADARVPAAWWDGQAFDVVLADVPCSASGIVRRHPDIRWLRRPQDIAPLVAIQREILDALWRTVRCGGVLLFVTCSVFPEEGESQAQAFLARHPDAQRESAPGQVLPLAEQSLGKPSGDGFFYALFTKTTA